MTQAILTKYLGPTSSRGARVRAKAWGGSVILPYDYALTAEGNHDAAALALVTKLNWRGAWVVGGLPDQTGNVYVNSRNAPPVFVR